MFNKKINTFILIILLTSLIVFILKTRFSYVPNKYEKELISYFSEVALKTEFYDTPKKL